MNSKKTVLLRQEKHLQWLLMNKNGDLVFSKEKTKIFLNYRQYGTSEFTMDLSICSASSQSSPLLDGACRQTVNIEPYLKNIIIDCVLGHLRPTFLLLTF